MEHSIIGVSAPETLARCLAAHNYGEDRLPGWRRVFFPGSPVHEVNHRLSGLHTLDQPPLASWRPDHPVRRVRGGIAAIRDGNPIHARRCRAIDCPFKARCSIAHQQHPRGLAHSQCSMLLIKGGIGRRSRTVRRLASRHQGKRNDHENGNWVASEHVVILPFRGLNDKPPPAQRHPRWFQG